MFNLIPVYHWEFSSFFNPIFHCVLLQLVDATASSYMDVPTSMGNRVSKAHAVTSNET